MASILKAVIKAIDKSSKARARELRQVQIAYNKQLKEEQLKQKAEIKERLKIEKEQAAALKYSFENMFEKSKNMLVKREIKRNEIIRKIIANNFK